MPRPVLCLLGAAFLLFHAAGASVAAEETDAAAVGKIIAAAEQSDFAFKRLARLCDTFGPRFTGSTNLEAAIDWIVAEMKKDGLHNVRTEEVTVPHWVRGNESAELLSPRIQTLHMLGLGSSVPTPPGGITAEVLVVTNFADLESRPGQARGKIVLFNQPFTEYGKTVVIRSRGAMAAAKAGAVAGLIRSVTPVSLQTPHTGHVRYSDDIPKIPHAALTVEDAELLQRMQDRGEKIVVRMVLDSKILPDTVSRNVIAEWPGREKPEEIVVVGGHIDSWDVGQGAMDDAGGCVAAWEAARLLKHLGLRPRRTLRVVFWTNEETRVAGAEAYYNLHKDELSRHVLAIEMDDGPFRPVGFAFSGSGAATAKIRRMAALLKPLGAEDVVSGAGGVDISQLKPAGVPLMDLRVDMERYYWYHHTAADTMDKLNLREFNRCVAALAGMAFMAADHPESLRE